MGSSCTTAPRATVRSRSTRSTRWTRATRSTSCRTCRTSTGTIARRRCAQPPLSVAAPSRPPVPPPRRAAPSARQGLKHASPSYMSKQTDINAKMRAILIDWLVEVHLKFKLMPETLYLTVNLIDRYLEKEQIMRNKLQLVGVTAMFIASKYEEIYAPECRDFVYISDKAYTREQILQMEGLMLSKLNFQLTTPNALVFLRRFVKAACPARSPAAPRSQPELHAPRVDTYNTAHRAPPLAGGQSTSHALWEATAPCSLLRLPPYCCPLPRQARTLPGRADAARV